MSRFVRIAGVRAYLAPRVKHHPRVAMFEVDCPMEWDRGFWVTRRLGFLERLAVLFGKRPGIALNMNGGVNRGSIPPTRLKVPMPPGATLPPPPDRDNVRGR